MSQSRAESWRVDVHHHVVPPEFADDSMPIKLPDTEAQLRSMESWHIRAAITSVTPRVLLKNLDRLRAVARACNEFQAQMVRDHPARFGAFALHARAAGFRVLVDYNTAGYRYPLSSVIVTQKILRTQESAIRRFLEAHIEAVHRFKTDANFAMNVIAKYTQTTDRAMLEETQRVYADAFERIPYPNVEDMKLGITQVSETNPRAKGADPKDFVDSRLLREIEASGFVKKLYGEQGK